MERRVIENLDANIQKKAFYDAHQLVKALFDRFNKKGNVSRGFDFAEKYAEIFAENEQYELCINVGQQLLRLVRNQDTPPSTDVLNKLSMLFLLCPPDTTVTKYRFMSDLIDWSKTIPTATAEEKKHGSKELHSLIANAYLEERKFGLCQMHLIYTDDTIALVTVTTTWQEECYELEKPYIVLRLALILMLQLKFEVASEYLLKTAGEMLNSPTCPPPIQIAWLTLQACKLGLVDFYDLLGRKYTLVMRYDSGVRQLFDSLEGPVFNRRRQTPSLLNMMGQMFSGMGAGVPSPMALAQ